MEKTTETRRPTHLAFIVDGEGDNAQWTEIGALWQHTDRKGFNLTLKAIPVSGRLVIRERQTQTEGKRGQ